MNNYIDNECIKTLRVMGAEIITKAKSGHPGIVLGAAPIVHTLFTRHLNIDSNDDKCFISLDLIFLLRSYKALDKRIA